MLYPGRFLKSHFTWFVTLFVCSSVSVTNAAAAENDQKPNIIFILTDDQRFDALGCMGNDFIRTPHIDRLAREGTLFTNMFCTTSICATSRATFLTGQWERRHGIDGFRQPLTPQQWKQTFPQLLREQGYRTAMIGKWGLGGKLPVDQYDYFKGFSGQGRYYPKGKSKQPGEHLTHKLGAQTLDFLDTCKPGEPFLLQLYTKSAHCLDGDPWPFQPDIRYDHLFADVTIPLPKTATQAHFKSLPEFLQNSEARKRWQIRFANPELYQKSVKDYYRLIAGVDDVVGSIVAKLRERQLAENTVIIFTSDNGFYLGDRGLAGKWFMHEESIRLPLVIYDPRLPKHQRGKKVSNIVLNADIAPTIVELAGAEIPSTMQGRSLLPLRTGKKVAWRSDFLYEHRFAHPRIPKNEGVRAQRWKYTRYTSIEPVYEELYDLKTDPLEEQNLAGNKKYSKQLATMRSRWQELSKKLQ